DLDLLDVRPVALEPVVDAAADEPRAELGQGPVERRTLADDGIPMLEGDDRLRQLLEARDIELRVASEVDLEGPGEECLWPVRGSSRCSPTLGPDELLEQAGLGAVGERDQGAPDDRATGQPGRPADHDRSREVDVLRDIEHDALRPRSSR